MRSRLRICVPPPQDLEHLDQELHLEAWQFGHSLSLQPNSSFSKAFGHISPPCLPSVQLLTLVERPSPQEAEQELHSVQFSHLKSTGQWLILPDNPAQGSLRSGQSQGLPPFLGGTQGLERKRCPADPPSGMHDGPITVVFFGKYGGIWG